LEKKELSARVRIGAGPRGCETAKAFNRNKKKTQTILCSGALQASLPAFYNARVRVLGSKRPSQRSKTDQPARHRAPAGAARSTRGIKESILVVVAACSSA
jgi:hypothetical protein